MEQFLNVNKTYLWCLKGLKIVDILTFKYSISGKNCKNYVLNKITEVKFGCIEYGLLSFHCFHFLCLLFVRKDMQIRPHGFESEMLIGL